MQAPFDTTIHVRSPIIDYNVSLEIQKFRQAVSTEKLYIVQRSWCTDATLHRFLIARQFEIPAAAELLMSALSWRITRIPPVGGMEALPNWKERMHKECQTGKIWIPGFDRWGRAVVVLDHTAENTYSVNDQTMFLIWNLEFACKMVDAGQTADKYVMFIHLERFSLFNCPAISSVGETSFMVKSAFPERLGHIILYATPAVFETLYQTVFKFFLDPRTVSKLVFIVGDCSDGSANDLKLKTLIADDWKVMCGAEQPIYVEGGSPGYDHSKYWPLAMSRMDAILNASKSTSSEGCEKETGSGSSGAEISLSVQISESSGDDSNSMRGVEAHKGLDVTEAAIQRNCSSSSALSSPSSSSAHKFNRSASRSGSAGGSSSSSTISRLSSVSSTRYHNARNCPASERDALSSNDDWDDAGSVTSSAFYSVCDEPLHTAPQYRTNQKTVSVTSTGGIEVAGARKPFGPLVSADATESQSSDSAPGETVEVDVFDQFMSSMQFIFCSGAQEPR